MGSRRVYAPALRHRRGDFLFSSFIAGAILHPLLGIFTSLSLLLGHIRPGERGRGSDRLCDFPIRCVAPGAGMDVGVVALIALNDMFLAFLVWVLPRSAVVLAVALGLSSAFLLLCMPSRGFGCFCLLRLAWRRFLSGCGLCRWWVLWWRCGCGFGEGLSSRRCRGWLVGWGVAGVDGGRHSHA